MESNSVVQASTATNNGGVFTFFSRFSPEIRALIWKEVCFQSRNLIISGIMEACVSYHYHFSFQNGPKNFDTYAYTTQTPVAPVLHATKESWSEALKWYSLDFGVEVSRNDTKRSFNFRVNPILYINWAADTRCLVALEGVHASQPKLSQDLDFLQRCRENGLQSLAYNLEICPSAGMIGNWCRQIPSLQNLILFRHFQNQPLNHGHLEFKPIAGALGSDCQIRKPIYEAFVNSAKEYKDEVCEVLDDLSQLSDLEETVQEAVEDAKQKFGGTGQPKVHLMALWQDGNESVVEEFKGIIPSHCRPSNMRRPRHRGGCIRSLG